MIEDLKKSQNIGIVIADHENIDFVTVALVFFLIAKKINKQVYYKLNNELPIIPQSGFIPQIVLSVKKQILDIYYEKTENSVKLFLTPKNEDISLDDLKCEILNSGENVYCDLVISIGFKTLKELEDALKNDFKINGADIINIDNSHLNKRFGKINLIENGASVSKVLFNNLEEDLVDRNIASLLLAGIKEGEIETIQKLIEKGGKTDTVYKIKSLISVLNKIEFKQDVYLSEIDDLDESDIPFILKIIKDYFSIKDFILIFNKKNCIFYSNKKDVLEKIKLHFNAQIKNNGGIFSKENLNKEEILNILK